MRLLFNIDNKDYKENGKAFIRDSVRSIIIKDNKVAMVYSKRYDYYKFPGGGIEENETHIDALIRETLEEAGLVVIKDSIKEYGYVHRVEKSDQNGIDMFIQDNYYYLCDVNEKVEKQILDDYEAFENFTLVFVDAYKAINTNRYNNHGPKNQNMLEREAKVLELLLLEKYII